LGHLDPYDALGSKHGSPRLVSRQQVFTSMRLWPRLKARFGIQLSLPVAVTLRGVTEFGSACGASRRNTASTAIVAKCVSDRHRRSPKIRLRIYHCGLCVVACDSVRSKLGRGGADQLQKLRQIQARQRTSFPPAGTEHGRTMLDCPASPPAPRFCSSAVAIDRGAQRPTAIRGAKFQH
jgi:hypothetical protein